MSDHPRITTLEGVAAPLPLPNLDTDQIMPKQFLRGIDKSGLAEGVFHDLRVDAEGQPHAEFVLNQPIYADARILVAGPNFGCGSSREHAVWGLQQAGVVAVVAPSFGEIFYSNALNNRLLAAQVDAHAGQCLLDAISAHPGLSLRIDIAAGHVLLGNMAIPFQLSARHRMMFLEGLDMIGATLSHQSDIEAFARRRTRSHPWLHDVGAKVRAWTSESHQETV
jgi:3-isopropylmalate/(R)-2-methylmalate dehydratase small subunit